MFGGVFRAGHLDDAYSRESARSTQQVDAVRRKPPLLPGVGIVRHHEIPPGERSRDVHLGVRTCVPSTLHRLPWTQQRLRRNARPVRALAADQFSLHHGHVQPSRSQGRRAVLSGCATTEHNHAVVGHVGSSVPACSATM